MNARFGFCSSFGCRRSSDGFAAAPAIFPGATTRIIRHFALSPIRRQAGVSAERRRYLSTPLEEPEI